MDGGVAARLLGVRVQVIGCGLVPPSWPGLTRRAGGGGALRSPMSGTWINQQQSCAVDECCGADISLINFSPNSHVRPTVVLRTAQQRSQQERGRSSPTASSWQWDHHLVDGSLTDVQALWQW